MLLLKKFFNYSTKTKQIYVGNSLLGTSLATNSAGAVKQVLDYYPFGDIRLNEQTGLWDGRPQDKQKKLIG